MKIFDKIEKKNADVFQCLSAVISVICIRNCLEILLGTLPADFFTAVHYSLFYISLFPWLIFIFQFFSGNTFSRSLVFSASGFILILIAPVADAVTVCGRIQYLKFNGTDELLSGFFSFFGGGKFLVSSGILIEMLILHLLFFSYLYCKTKKLFQAAAGCFLLYLLIFFWFCTPDFLMFIRNRFNLNLDGFPESLCWYFAFQLFLGSLLLIRHNFGTVKLGILLREICLYRLSHYLLMFALGAAVTGHYRNFQIRDLSFSGVLLFCFSICSAYAFSTAVNNYYDQKIDRISSPHRALVSEKISTMEYLVWTVFMFYSGIIAAFSAGFQAGMIYLAFCGVYYLYSAEPLRFKRLPVFSKLAIAFNSWIIFQAGFFYGGQGYFYQNRAFCLFFLTAFTLCSSLIDLKDIDGDRAVHIFTIPVLYGLKKSRIIMAVSVFISCMVLTVFLRQTSVRLFSAAAGMLLAFSLVYKEYSEKYFFRVYLFFLLILTCLLLKTA